MRVVLTHMKTGGGYSVSPRRPSSRAHAWATDESSMVVPHLYASLECTKRCVALERSWSRKAREISRRVRVGRARTWSTRRPGLPARSPRACNASGL